MQSWHYMKNGAQNGPVTSDELTSLLVSAAIPADTMVWREGLANWAPARTLPEFAGVVPNLPPPPPAAPLAPTGSVNAPFTPEAADVDKNKIFAILGYLGILFLVPLLAARESKFAMYHCNQGFVLFLCVFVCAFFLIIPILGLLIWFVAFISWLVFAIMGIINAANGVCKPLPLIGNRFTLVK